MLVDLGVQSFEILRERNAFYIDKTLFIKEWWEYGSSVTLLTRPRRFGKTLNMTMLECFFSNKYAGRGDLFEGLSIWDDEMYRQIQGTYPVIFLSFASVKTGCIRDMKAAVKKIIANLYNEYAFLMEADIFKKNEKEDFASVNKNMSDETAETALNSLCIYLEKYYGKKVIVILDEYDTPMQEAWLAGNWEEAVAFFRGFLNAVFKTNPCMYRGIITGITRVSKESVFSDLNNLDVITTTSDEYARYFGFTEEEVFQALDDVGLGGEKQGVRQWYDGFTFGAVKDIYNPWSIMSFIRKKGKYGAYWAGTSSNGLVSSLIQKGGPYIKQTMECLMQGKSFEAQIDEQIVFNQLDDSTNAIWSLLLAAGYLRVVECGEQRADMINEPRYILKLTNHEVMIMFRKMVKSWFRMDENDSVYNDFIKALLSDDVDAMNEFMNRIALQSFSSFDIANSTFMEDSPERFYHGFVLGLIVDLEGRFVITSNRESGFGRYDIMLRPADKERDNAYIIEFKVHRAKKEKTLDETVANALAQIEEKRYEAGLLADGVKQERIRKYGFAFEGKRCLSG